MIGPHQLCSILRVITIVLIVLDQGPDFLNIEVVLVEVLVPLVSVFGFLTGEFAHLLLVNLSLSSIYCT